MKQLLLTVLFIAAIQACTTGNDTSGNADSTAVDSTAGIAVDLNDSAASSPVRFYELNDSLVKGMSCRELKPKEVRALFYPLQETGSKLAENVYRFLQLDSITRGKKQNDFDIGVVTKVKIYFIDTLYANTDYTLCSWMMEVGSFEACPYWGGTLIGITSFDDKGKQISTVCVAENSSGGDPPVWGSNYQSAKVYSDGKIEFYLESSYGEDDDGEKTISSQTGKVSAAGLITLDKVEELSKKKIKAESAQ